MDAGGIRPTVLDMADRLAEAGYLVLLPDLFYRYGSYWKRHPRFEPQAAFEN
jgi:carboxymethylenebutenolidase